MRNRKKRGSVYAGPFILSGRFALQDKNPLVPDSSVLVKICVRKNLVDSREEKE